MRIKNRLLGLGLLFLLTHSAMAAPLGNPDAPKGGTFTIGLPGYPKSLLFYLAYEELALATNLLVFETLIDSHPDTNEYIPLLAESWTISPDKKVFTFKLNKAAKFSDGKPVTAEDVKFTWDTITNPKNKTVPFQSALSSFSGCEIVDPQTVKFTAKTLHFKNLEKIGGLMVLPKHFYSKGDFNKSFHLKLLGSGPYTLDSVKQGERIYFKRNPDYWGAKLEQNIGRYNFDRVTFRVAADPNVQFELFKKGDLDYFYFLSAKMWSTETDGAPFKNNYIKKIKAENLLPFSTQGYVWNLRRPLFQDVRVRRALSHLINREKWIKDLFYNNYELATGPVGMKSEYHSPNNKPLSYDPKEARKLLAEAGWDKVGADGIRRKGDLKFEFEMLTDNPGAQRYLTLLQEDLRREAGIKMNIRTVDWATALKLNDDRQFDVVEQARGRDTDPSDFNVVWGSKEADIKGSANTAGYKNPELDALAQKIDETFDKKQRIPLVQKIDEMIGRDQPMSFAWEATFYRLGHWNRFGYPGKGYFQYSNWKNTFHYWWFDKDKDAALAKARKEGKPLP